MNADELQIGDEVILTETWRYHRPVCEVVAIQRRRFRAMIEWPGSGNRTWHPVRLLRLAPRDPHEVQR